MKRLSAIAILLMVLPAAPSMAAEKDRGQTKAAASTNASKGAEQEILDLERQRTEARKTGDRATLERLVSNDYTGISRTGDLVTKPGLMELGADPDYVADDLSVRVYDKVATVVGRHSVQSEDGPRVWVRFTRVWAKDGDRWENVAYQGSEIKEGVANPSRSTKQSNPHTPAIAGPAAVGTSGNLPRGAKVPHVAALGIDNSAASSYPDPEIQKTLDTMNKGYWGKNVNAYAAYVGNDFLRVSNNGTVMTRGDLLDAMKEGPQPSSSALLSDVKIRTYGNVAVATMKQTSGQMGLSRPSRYTRVFVKRDGKWQLVSSHQTEIGRDSAAQQ